MSFVDTDAVIVANMNNKNNFRKLARIAKHLTGFVILLVAIWWLADVIDTGELWRTLRAVTQQPAAAALALVAYAAAFWVRAMTWHFLQPTISTGQAWAAIHVGLVSNHVLPLRLGEAMRVTSAARRTPATLRDTAGVTIALRLGDLLALLLIAFVAAPLALKAVLDTWSVLLIGLVLAVGIVAAWRFLGPKSDDMTLTGKKLAIVTAAVTGAWLLEAVVLFVVARSAGMIIAGSPLTVAQAAGVTAVTIFAQVIAVTPGGFGTYEAAGTAALLALGADVGIAFAVVLTTHAIKTLYSLALGGIAFFVPRPGYWGSWRLPRQLPQRQTHTPNPNPDSPIVVFLPAHNEEAVIGEVLRRIPGEACGHPIEVIVIDDGSTDNSAEIAAAEGAHIISHDTNRGLGAAVRTGLAAAVQRNPAAGVYLDADGEYSPENIADVVAPVLDGTADYVIGSRFSGQIDRMLPHRRFGNRVLTRWVRWMTRQPHLTDGQSGFRAFSAEALAAAEIIHDYNYAQVLTLDLLGKGFRYDEVPIDYAFRTSGTSFISLGTYLRKVIPAVHRELNEP